MDAVKFIKANVPTPREFKEQMHNVRVLYGDNEEVAHSIMDGKMCDLLRELGYGGGVAEFEAQNKWYAQAFGNGNNNINRAGFKVLPKTRYDVQIRNRVWILPIHLLLHEARGANPCPQYQGKGVRDMKVTCEVQDQSHPAMPNIKVHSSPIGASFIEVEIDGKTYTVCGRELIKAIENAMNTQSQRSKR